MRRVHLRTGTISSYSAFIFTVGLAVLSLTGMAKKPDTRNGTTQADQAIADIEQACKDVPETQKGHLDIIFSQIQTPYKSLIRQGKNGTPAIASVIADKKRDWRLHYFLVGTLGEIRDPKSLPILKEILLSSDYYVAARKVVPHMLGKFDESPEINGILIEAAKSPNVPNEVKRSVMSIIGAIGVDDFEFLKAMLDFPVKEMNDLGVVFNAIRAMGESKKPEATDILIDLMLNRFPGGSLARGVILEALGLRKDLKAVPAIIHVLEGDKDSGNRARAAEVLGDLQASEAVDALIKALNDPEWEVVCSRAAEALGKIGDRRAAPYIKRIIDNLPNDPRFDLRLKYPEGDMSVPAIKKAYDKLTK